MPECFLILEQGDHRDAWGCAGEDLGAFACDEGIDPLKKENAHDDNWIESKNFAGGDFALVCFSEGQEGFEWLTEVVLEKLCADHDLRVWLHYGDQLAPNEIPERWRTTKSLSEEVKKLISDKLKGEALPYPIPCSQGQSWAFDNSFKEAERAFKRGNVSDMFAALLRAWSDAQGYFGIEREIAILHAALPLRMTVRMIQTKLSNYRELTAESQCIHANELARNYELKRTLEALGLKAKELGEIDPFGGLDQMRGTITSIERFSRELSSFCRKYDNRASPQKRGLSASDNDVVLGGPFLGVVFAAEANSRGGD